MFGDEGGSCKSDGHDGDSMSAVVDRLVIATPITVAMEYGCCRGECEDVGGDREIWGVSDGDGCGCHGRGGEHGGCGCCSLGVRCGFTLFIMCKECVLRASCLHTIADVLSMHDIACAIWEATS